MGQLRTANRRHLRVRGRLRDAQRSRAIAPWHARTIPRLAASGHPIEIVGTAAIPGGGRLHLARCDGAYSIQFHADELMGSTDHVSEEALATMACQRLARDDGAVLIGGLGMGFTLGAALSAWGAGARIVVAELVPEVVAWAHGPLAHLLGASLRDPRVSIEVADVHDVIDRADAAFDAILLDVDNGPDGFMRAENDRLYCNWGLRAALGALRPGGVLAIWSAYPDAEFRERLEAACPAVEERRVPAYAGSTDDHHVIWFARKPA